MALAAGLDAGGLGERHREGRARSVSMVGLRVVEEEPRALGRERLGAARQVEERARWGGRRVASRCARSRRPGGVEVARSLRPMDQRLVPDGPSPAPRRRVSPRARSSASRFSRPRDEDVLRHRPVEHRPRSSVTRGSGAPGARMASAGGAFEAIASGEARRRRERARRRGGPRPCRGAGSTAAARARHALGEERARHPRAHPRAASGTSTAPSAAWLTSSRSRSSRMIRARIVLGHPALVGGQDADPPPVEGRPRRARRRPAPAWCRPAPRRRRGRGGANSPRSRPPSGWRGR